MRRHRPFWLLYIILLYSYLLTCMFGGAPFVAFDHVNYIDFLNSPSPRFFEPGYTVLAYALNTFAPSTLRFPLIFSLGTIPPAIMVLTRGDETVDNTRELIVFAAILTKGFIVGFIAQRFFMAELWTAALLIRYQERLISSWRMVIPSLFHFGSVGALPVLLYLRIREDSVRASLAFLAVAAAATAITMLSTIEFLGYDYSRYFVASDGSHAFPVATLLQTTVLAVVCLPLFEARARISVFLLITVVFLVKWIVGDIEVYSRMFQIQTDVLLIVAGMVARKPPLRIYAYAVGFAVLQATAMTRSNEVLFFHYLAFSNALASWF